MGWFGGGSSNTSPSSGSSDFTASDSTDSFGGGTNFASPMSSPSSQMAELQQFSVELQSQVLVQAVVTDMADKSFARCIQGKPGDSLSGRDVACVHATVGKWLDANEFMVGRLQKKAGG